MKLEDWLAIGLTPKARLSFAKILEVALDVESLRGLASKHGTKPKGFRIARASGEQLANAIAADFVDKKALREDVAQALVGDAAEPAERVDEGAALRDAERRAEKLSLENSTQRERLSKAEQSAQRASTSRENALEQRALAEQRAVELELRCSELEAERSHLERALANANASEDEERDSASSGRERVLQAELDALRENDEKNRRRIAELTSRLRALESENAELLEFLPRGERERRKQLRRSFEEAQRSSSLVPSFEDEFFRSVAALDATSQRKVYVAIAKFILHGPEYPGLQTKVLRGMDGLSSIRAADDLRVYLRRSGEQVRFEACGNREQQDAFLKKRR